MALPSQASKSPPPPLSEQGKDILLSQGPKKKSDIIKVTWPGVVSTLWHANLTKEYLYIRLPGVGVGRAYNTGGLRYHSGSCYRETVTNIERSKVDIAHPSTPESMCTCQKNMMHSTKQD